MKVGVVTFPGTLDDRDAARAVGVAGATAVSLWHGDADLKGVDAVVLPGGGCLFREIIACLWPGKAVERQAWCKGDSRGTRCAC